VKKVTLVLLLATLYNVVFSQSCPTNIDFEAGDFSNWQCYTGSVRSINGQNSMTLLPSEPIAGRHEIIPASNMAKDQYGGFPMHCPYGGKFSVKLGNNSSGGEAEALSYTFQVPASVDTFTFTYFYAVVFEDPQHTAYDQPRFFVTAYDVLTGSLINCASYDYIATSNLPGFTPSTSYSGVLYKNWSPVSIQFAGLANRMVRLEFRTADCTLGGHFGYAYVDVGTGCSNILATAPYCRETNSLLLNAPYGFQTYTWYNEDYSAIMGNQQSITLTPPPAISGKFHVDMIPYPGFGCRDTADAMVVPLPVPDTPVAVSDYAICQFSSNPPLTATVKPNHDLLWYSGATGGAGNTLPPTPSTTNPGMATFYVSQKELFGCESFRKEIRVDVIPTPVASFAPNAISQCLKGNSFTFTNTATNLQNTLFAWNYGDGVNDTTYNTNSVTHTYTRHGNFQVRLKALNPPTCFTEQVKQLRVIPKPVAAFQYPAVICEKQTPINLFDASSVPEGLSVINKWWWEINGTPLQARQPTAFIPATPGILPVKLVVTTQEGCESDTNAIRLPVHYRPIADFSYGPLLCDNEIIQFTDKSMMPAGSSPEFVAKWNWLLNNTQPTQVRHPQFLFAAGVRHAVLIAETNYGCRSLPADSVFAIHPKPAIGLDINDSCILRTIRYTALDKLNTVDKWYWDFGKGLYEDDDHITKSFSREGSYPFTLLAKTIHGCKDTIVRPFTIFDNKSFAGHDTLAAINEPVQLNALGGLHITYNWSPSTGLNNPVIENPVATLDRDQLYELHTVSDKGCVHDSKIFIKRYNGPDLYIPTAFSPNNDQNNDAYKIFPVGIKKFLYFAIYNRYGQQVYYSSDYKTGWDGTIKGVPQDQGNYVVVAKAIDYRGLEMSRKGFMVLIR
jgi:gliding motility-associated-like protein